MVFDAGAAGTTPGVAPRRLSAELGEGVDLTVSDSAVEEEAAWEHLRTHMAPRFLLTVFAIAWVVFQRRGRDTPAAQLLCVMGLYLAVFLLTIAPATEALVNGEGAEFVLVALQYPSIACLIVTITVASCAWFEYGSLQGRLPTLRAWMPRSKSKALLTWREGLEDVATLSVCAQIINGMLDVGVRTGARVAYIPFGTGGM